MKLRSASAGSSRLREALIAWYESRPPMVSRWGPGGRRAESVNVSASIVAKLRAGEPVTVTVHDLRNAAGVECPGGWYHVVVGPSGELSKL